MGSSAVSSDEQLDLSPLVSLLFASFNPSDAIGAYMLKSCRGLLYLCISVRISLLPGSSLLALAARLRTPCPRPVPLPLFPHPPLHTLLSSLVLLI
eukprot:764411-Hanusia_phi.AAC.3